MFVFWKVLQHFPEFYSSLKKTLPILGAFPLLRKEIGYEDLNELEGLW